MQKQTFDIKSCLAGNPKDVSADVSRGGGKVESIVVVLVPLQILLSAFDTLDHPAQTVFKEFE